MNAQAYTATRPPTAVHSQRCREIMNIFALSPGRLERSKILRDIPVKVGGVTYVTGYSGSGKSTLLRLIMQRHTRVLVPAPPLDETLPLIDLVGTNVKEAMEVFGWAGLGEAFIYLTPYQCLSDGQKARAQLALALSQKPELLIVDEFLSNLDRVTAKVVAYNFQRVCRTSGTHAVVATAHADLLEPLAPDHFIRLDLHGGYQAQEWAVPHAYIPEFTSIALEHGTEDDYRALARFHYFGDAELGADSDFKTEIFRLRHEGSVIGVVVLQAPYPHDWEEAPYFREVCDRLRVLTRLVIHPSFRGAGLAKLLMRPSLSRIPFIETRSALGLYQPIYLSAGYRTTDLPGNQRTSVRGRLEEFLRVLGVNDTHTFHDIEACETMLLGLTELQRGQLHEMCLALYVEGLMNDYVYYRSVAELPPLDLTSQQELHQLFRDACDQIPTEMLLQETVYFPMQGFAVQHSSESTAI